MSMVEQQELKEKYYSEEVRYIDNAGEYLKSAKKEGMVHPMDYSPVFNRDIYVLIFGTLRLLLFMFTGKKRQIDRWQASIFVLLYTAYVIYLIKMD